MEFVLLYCFSQVSEIKILQFLDYFEYAGYVLVFNDISERLNQQPLGLSVVIKNLYLHWQGISRMLKGRGTYLENV